MAIRVVAFDLGNVLLEWRLSAVADALGRACGLSSDDALGAVASVVRDGLGMDRGEAPPARFLNALDDRLRAAGGAALPFDAFRQAWCAGLSPRRGATALVRRLRPGLGVAVWSNTDPVHFAHYAPWLPFLGGARALSLSFLLGAAKPEERFFRAAIAATGVAPHEVAFLDDLAENVAAAAAIGVDAQRVATLAEVEDALRSRGLLE